MNYMDNGSLYCVHEQKYWYTKVFHCLHHDLLLLKDVDVSAVAISSILHYKYLKESGKSTSDFPVGNTEFLKRAL